MFNRNFFGPGGRESRFSNTETELRIPAGQLLRAIAALWVAAFVIHRVAVVPLTALVWDEGATVYAVRSWAFVILLAAFTAGPLLLYAYAMILNIVDPNWTPSRQAAPPELGPMAPGILRWPLRWLWRAPQPEAQAMGAPTAQAEAPETRAVEATLLFRADDNDRVTYRGVITLFTEEWERLSAMARARANFSVRELHRAGFKSPRDRDVAKMLSSARLTVGVGRDVVPVESFRRWLADNGWQRPTLPGGETVTV